MDKAVMFNTELDELMGDFAFRKLAFHGASISTGFIICKLAFETMKRVSPACFPNTYRKLSDKEKLEWKNRAMSTAHAIVVSLVAAYLCFCTDLFANDAPYGPVVLRSTVLSHFFLGVSLAYFITDLVMILRSYPGLGGAEYVVHHGVSIACLLLGMHSGNAHVYLYTVFLSEITTPCINLRWYLATAKMKKTRAYILNGFVMFLTWLVFRIANFAYVFVHIYRHHDELKEIHTVEYILVFLSTVTYAGMNLYWFEKIAKGLIKTLTEKRE